MKYRRMRCNDAISLMKYGLDDSRTRDLDWTSAVQQDWKDLQDGWTLYVSLDTEAEWLSKYTGRYMLVELSVMGTPRCLVSGIRESKMIDDYVKNRGEFDFTDKMWKYVDKLMEDKKEVHQRIFT